tara:strand:+ start:715 stop:843 length:129 start_codon:yes stop_codon:yes gene_type:complete
VQVQEQGFIQNEVIVERLNIKSNIRRSDEEVNSFVGRGYHRL